MSPAHPESGRAVHPESSRGARLWTLAAVLVLSGCVRFVPLPDHAEVSRAKTADGWEIALVRYRPQGPPTGRPVVLVHGISANARNMDLDEGHSLARWLAAQGREAWTVSLRGSGESTRPEGNVQFSFDDYWQRDLPAVFAEVKRASGADAVDYIGHSMGGLVLYAYLSQGGKDVHAAATLGSPGRIDWGTGVEGWLGAGAKLLPRSWMIPSALGAHAAVPFQGLVDDGPFQRFFYNHENTPLETWQRLMAYGTSDVSVAVAVQLAPLATTGQFLSADGTIDLGRDMQRVTTPVMVVAAKLDRVAIAPAVYAGYRRLGGPKAWLMISRAHGARAEYGHMDLVVGERAHLEVWTPVLAFFNRFEPGPPR